MIRQNLGYKLFALLAAIALWIHVNSEQSPSTSLSLNVPLETRNIAQGMVIEGLPEKISVVITGPKQYVNELQPGQVVAYVDLSGLGAGIHPRIPVKVEIPEHLNKRLQAQPAVSLVSGTIEMTVSRTFPIDLNTTAVSAVGKKIVRPEILPASAVVTGSSNVVERIRRLQVNVEINNATKILDDFYPISAFDSDGKRINGVIIEPKEARVKAQLAPAQVSKSVPVSPRIVGLPTFPFKLEEIYVEPPMVTISGSAETLAKIGTVFTENINIEGLNHSTKKVVKLHPPIGATISGAQIVEVTIKITP